MTETEESGFFLAELWVEMLGYAAANCSGNNHAQQLRRGGELLSQVWLLQAHFGVLEQFRVTEMQQAVQGGVTEMQQDNQPNPQNNEALQGRGLQVSGNVTSVREIEIASSP